MPIIQGEKRNMKSYSLICFTAVLILAISLSCTLIETQYASAQMGFEHAGAISTIQTITSDSSIWVSTTTTDPKEGERMSITANFFNKDGRIEVATYDIIATQDGKIILDEKGVHKYVGDSTHLTSPLTSDNPVDIKITLQGDNINLPFDWPKGEAIDVKTVPEFGMITTMVLALSIISIIAITTKSKIIPKL